MEGWTGCGLDWMKLQKTRRRMARERRGAGSSLVWRHHITKQYFKDVL